MTSSTYLTFFFIITFSFLFIPNKISYFVVFLFMSNIRTLSVLILFLLAIQTLSADYNRYLTPQTEGGACLDGSAPAYYFDPGFGGN